MLRRHTQRNDVVVDLYAGVGDFASLARQNGIHVLCVDPDAVVVNTELQMLSNSGYSL